jgi:hypothetical protein
MYFFKNKGKQCLDLSGNLILSYNNHLIAAKLKSHAPFRILNPFYVVKIGDLTLWKKIKTSFTLIKFIWMEPKNLLVPTVDKTVCNVKTKTIKKNALAEINPAVILSDIIDAKKEKTDNCQRIDKKEQPLDEYDSCSR